MYRDMWERAMDEGLEMLLRTNTEGAYFLGTAQVPKFGLKATFKPQVCTCTSSQETVQGCHVYELSCPVQCCVWQHRRGRTWI